MSKKTKIYNYTCTKNSEELTRCQRSSCWAFSTTGSTEGAWQIGTGNLLSVSEQQLVDCATATSSGCQGGSMAGAIQHKSGTAMATEASYPYTARDGTCKSSFTAAIPNGGITGYKSVGNIFPGASKSSMQSAVQQQPVSIAIETDEYAFQAYQRGQPWRHLLVTSLVQPGPSAVLCCFSPCLELPSMHPSSAFLSSAWV